MMISPSAVKQHPKVGIVGKNGSGKSTCPVSKFQRERARARERERESSSSQFQRSLHNSAEHTQTRESGGVVFFARNRRTASQRILDSLYPYTPQDRHLRAYVGQDCNAARMRHRTLGRHVGMQSLLTLTCAVLHRSAANSPAARLLALLAGRLEPSEVDGRKGRCHDVVLPCCVG